MNELRQPRAILALFIVLGGLVSIGVSLYGWMTGAAEWRPGARIDSMLLMGAVTGMALGGICLIPAPDPSVALPMWRKVLGWVATGVSVVLLVWHVVRMG